MHDPEEMQSRKKWNESLSWHLSEEMGQVQWEEAVDRQGACWPRGRCGGIVKHCG